MNPAAPAVRRLARIAARSERVSAPDGELLARYRADRNADAFAALVERHGPMVLGLCRRITGDSHAADDAFQATFLALSRKASTVRKPEALPAWLFGTARRIALRARARLARQRTAEPSEGPSPEADPLDRLSARELLAAIDEELDLLPTTHRSALILCTLEGLAIESAAKQLGATVGSVRGWLQRGRDRLRSRLARRGLTAPALAAALMLPQPSLSAPLLEAVARIAAAPAS